MRLVSKKTVAAIVLGVFVLTGAAIPFIAQAEQGGKERSAFGHRQFDPEKAAARMAEDYGISKEAILAHNQNGVSFRDLNRAAFLAKASGKSLDDVLALKKSDNTWRDVAQTLNISKDQMKATFRSLAADRLNAKLGLDRQETMNLLEQGYRPRDVAIAGVLAQESGKSSQDILAMKKINNAWRDVAQNLGMNDEAFKQSIQKLRPAFGPGGHKHWK